MTEKLRKQARDSSTEKNRHEISERIIPVGNRKTMLTIQLNTYEERKKTSDYAFETKQLERKELIEKLSLKNKNKQTKTTSIKKQKKTQTVDNIEIGEEE